MVIISCVLWLFINLLAQAGIAMLSLTYGFDPCDFDLQFNKGDVSIPNLDHFYDAEWSYVDMDAEEPSFQYEVYTAHM